MAQILGPAYGTEQFRSDFFINVTKPFQILNFTRVGGFTAMPIIEWTKINHDTRMKNTEKERKRQTGKCIG
jgi:hypothetical protein